MREANRYISHYPVEHNPGENKDPYDVYDMLHLFEDGYSAFCVVSVSAATELIARLDEMKGKDYFSR